MTAPTALLAAKSALVIAHPGQELPVYGWLELVRPQVHVLTTGGGASGPARIGASARLLKQLGAKPGSVFGRMSEPELHERILKADAPFFRGLADELAAAFAAQRIEFVVGCAAEGTHVASDLLRAIIDVAAADASARLGWPVLNYEFTTAPNADACPVELRHRSLRLSLYEEAFERKLEAAALYVELADEVRALLIAAGIDAFRVECFWPATPASSVSHTPRIWEQRAEALVASGVHAQAIRYRDHVAPLVAQLKHGAKKAA